jgi:chaperonin GroES
MSYQLIEEDRNWLNDDEVAKFSASLLGCAVKESFYDGVQGINRSEFVPLANFTVDYYCKDLSRAQRITKWLTMFPNQIAENVARGLYLEMVEGEPGIPIIGSESQLRLGADQAKGMALQAQDTLRPYEILEQHCWLDLDDDGYAEPYVVTVRLDTAQVLRIAARYFNTGDVYRDCDKEIRQLERKRAAETDIVQKSRLEIQMEELEKQGRVLRIVPVQSFTRYLFIPSPDGGFYGLGLGALLGPTNAAVDTLINQLIDSGTMQSTAGGFLGRGVKIKSGKQSFDPFEWKPVDGVGDDLRKNIVPLPVNAPSDVLFQLLGVLIQYGEKIGSATDIMTGVSPGQNTPAETSRNTIEQGMMLFSGIYTRMYRAFGEELRNLYALNRLFLPQSPSFHELTEGENALILADDYDGNPYRITPAADANATSSAQKQTRAKALFDIATASPAGFDLYTVKRRLLEALEVESIEEVLPNPKGPKAVPPPKNPKVELEMAKLQQKSQEHQDNMQLHVAQLQMDMQVSQAKIEELSAKATKELAEANGVETGHQIALIEAQLGAQKAHKEHLQKLLDSLLQTHQANQTLPAQQGAPAGKLVNATATATAI